MCHTIEDLLKGHNVNQDIPTIVCLCPFKMHPTFITNVVVVAFLNESHKTYNLNNTRIS